MRLALAARAPAITRRAIRWAPAGDFVTAPEISQMFGELIGLWCVDAWEQAGAPDPFLLVELGPGRGTLMADALRAARVRPAFLSALRLHLVEISRPLRETQEQRLGAFHPLWHDDTDDAAGGAGADRRQRVPGCAADPSVPDDGAGLARARSRSRRAMR